MPAKPIDKCLFIIQSLREKGYTEECSKGDIKQIICENFGLHERTIRQYLTALTLFKHVRTKGNNIYEILVDEQGKPKKDRRK